jgi:hypothetical protein
MLGLEVATAKIRGVEDISPIRSTKDRADALYVITDALVNTRVRNNTFALAARLGTGGILWGAWPVEADQILDLLSCVDIFQGAHAHIGSGAPDLLQALLGKRNLLLLLILNSAKDPRSTKKSACFSPLFSASIRPKAR